MIKALASGRIVDVDEVTGLVTFETCPWHVSVPSRNPEPDSLADCWIEISCDEPLFADPGFEVHDGRHCTAGHRFGNLEGQWADDWADEVRDDVRYGYGF